MGWKLARNGSGGGGGAVTAAFLTLFPHLILVEVSGHTGGRGKYRPNQRKEEGARRRGRWGE